MTLKERIDGLLAQKRLAVVGVSRGESAFSRGLYREFARRGYDVVPVNPDADRIGETPCFARVGDIDPPPDAALLVLPPQAIEQALRDCAAAGVLWVWVHGPGAETDASRAAERLGEALGLTVVSGHCPYMFLPGTGWIHRLHGWILRRLGRYPE